MRMGLGAVVVGLGCILCSGSSAQTFVSYGMAGENLSDAGRGLDGAAVGDVIRLSLRPEHDGYSYAGGKVEMLYRGVVAGDITVSEDHYGGWFDPWEVGRHVLMRIVASDGPPDATQPWNVDVFASDALGGKVTDVNDDYMDLASTPPGLGGLPVERRIESGDAVFVFDYVYRGGEDLWDAGHNGEARLWRQGQDINGIVVPAFSGDTLVVSPAPGAWALVVLGGLGAARRRRA